MEASANKSEKTGGTRTMKGGCLVISLDFELHWGGFEKWPLDEGYKAYFMNTRDSIPTVLSLFQQSGLHATWATVGLLMHESKKQLLQNIPEIQPDYKEKNLSVYDYLNSHGIGLNEQEDPFHYAGSLLPKIQQTRGQEMGTHSFAHYYCNEPGQTVVQFKADLSAAIKAADRYKLKLNSLVFPRNQYNGEYLKACKEAGIKIVRINPLDWWWHIDSTQSESKWKRLNRGTDAYFSIGGKTSYHLDQISTEEGVILLPASRLLRPFNPKEFFLNSFKISRIKKEMNRAAANNEIYHLWWHPHNFGNYTRQNMEGLIEIANHFQKLHKEYGMMSKNMGEIAEMI